MKTFKQLLPVETARTRWLLGIVFALAALSVGGRAAMADESSSTVRWDVLNVDFVTLTLNAGGMASAKANDGSKITVTASGTFKIEDGHFEDVNGGGRWTTFDASNAVTGSGTYKATGVVQWLQAPGTPPLPHDNIGNLADSHAGLVVLRVSYSDGSRGILVVSCTIVGTPAAVFEGITATKGYVDYWNREAPPAPPVNGNRTNFHVSVTPDD